MAYKMQKLLMMAGLAAFALATVLTLTAVAATPLEEGVAAYKKSDYKAAYTLFQPLADKGDAYSAYNLGRMYEKGQGVQPSKVLSYKWFNIASTRYAPAQLEQRNEAIAQFTRVSKAMTAEEVAEAQKLAKEWKPQS